MALVLEQPVHEGEGAALPEGVAAIDKLVGPALEIDFPIFEISCTLVKLSHVYQ